MTVQVDTTTAFAIALSSMALSGAILRIRRDRTGPPLTRFIDATWSVSLASVLVWPVVGWIVGFSDAWLTWPLAVFGVVFLMLVGWDSRVALRRGRQVE